MINLMMKLLVYNQKSSKELITRIPKKIMLKFSKCNNSLKDLWRKRLDRFQIKTKPKF